MKFTACYTKLDDGKYMGKLLDWKGVITNEMAELYKDDDRKIPYTQLVVEPMYVSVAPECLQQNVCQRNL